MKRPTFFISSTIYDFSDLRSALKFYLERLGCEVLASEFNDFRKGIDEHSYQACLNSIHRADYFILLVGSRVGGWFDEGERISITRREYQEAYKLHCTGKLKILNFVRSDIWDLKDDRNELQKYLDEQKVLEKEIIQDVVNSPTKRMTDPEFIISFLNEIGRIKETKDAVANRGEFPTGNWVHTFKSFKDIIDVITPEIFNGEPIDDSALKKHLLVELREMLAASLVKLKNGAVFSPKGPLAQFYEDHKLDQSSKMNEYFNVSVGAWDLLSSLSVQLLALDYTPLILPRILSSSVFLEFDYRIGAFIELPIHKGLRLLSKEIQKFSELNNPKNLSVVYQYSPKDRRPGVASVRLRTIELVTLLNLMQRWSNIIDYCCSIIRHLEGKPYVAPKVFGRSPVIGMNKVFKEGEVTVEELDNFINRSNSQ